MAERVGFEPTIPLQVCRISSAVHSTTLPPLRRAVVSGPFIATAMAPCKRKILFCLENHANCDPGNRQGFDIAPAKESWSSVSLCILGFRSRATARPRVATCPLGSSVSASRGVQTQCRKSMPSATLCLLAGSLARSFVFGYCASDLNEVTAWSGRCRQRQR